jgi:ABC-2 type transport system ATP-binding protein
MIEIDGLVKEYDGVRAVSGLSLVVRPGEILGLVGPNGAGKTSTLRCLCGIVRPTAGSVRIDGLDLERQPVEARRRLAFVADEPKLFDSLTVWDHVLVVSRIYGVADGKERGQRLLEDMGLAEKRDAFPAELSRGMKQKLSIAMALLHQPKALVLDEPLTGLDPHAMRRTRDRIISAAGEGVAVLLSSHMLHLVETLCHRVLIIARGARLLEGSMSEIRAAIPNLAQDASLEEIFLQATAEDAGY